MKKLLIGDDAPNFRVAISEDKQFSLSELLGKCIVVLYFYPKDATPGCTIEAKEFNALLPEFTKAGAKIIGISKDNLN